MTVRTVALATLIGLTSGVAAVAGLYAGSLGLWPALAVVAAGWAGALVLSLRTIWRAPAAPIHMPAGLRLAEREFAAGDVIIREGDPATSLYVIIAGKVQVWRSDEYGSRIDIAELVPGQIFGEMGLLDGGVRTASIEAVGPVRLFEVPREMFETLIAESGAIATMVREIARGRQAGH